MSKYGCWSCQWLTGQSENRDADELSMKDALGEIDRFFKKIGKVIVPLTVREILDEQIANKLA
jgi:hypothetical protein